MAHRIEKNEAGEYQMVSLDKEWHFFETDHPVLSKAATEEEFQEWATRSGLAREYEMTPAYQNIGSDDNETFAQIPDTFHCRRKDDMKVFGTFTDQFKVFQPIELINMGREFVSLDDRFYLESAMTLKGGSLLCASFAFDQDISIMGETHKLHLLLSTAMDGSRATTFQGVDIRAICDNTFQMAQRGAATFKLGHRSEWNELTKRQATQALENLLSETARFKKLAESLAVIRMSKDEAVKFLSSTIFVPKLIDTETATGEKVQVWAQPGAQEKRRTEELLADYEATLKEGTPEGAWAVFNAVTRYADHTQKVVKREGKSEATAKDESRLFGGAQAFKAKSITALCKALEINPQSFEVTQEDVDQLVAA